VILAGQIAVVTGGARNIGRAVAQALAEAGARVAIVDVLTKEGVETAAFLTAQGLNARAYAANLTDPAAVASVFQTIADDLGPVTLLCNNAGGGTDGAGPFAMVPHDKWWTLFERNIRSAVLCSHAVLPTMIKQGAGRIINTVSLFAFTPSMGGNSAYGAAKAGLTRFTEDLAVEVQHAGLSVFAIHPGGVRPAAGTYLTEPLPGMTRIQLDAILARLTDPPELAAGLCVKLASGIADGLTGRFFDATEDLDTVMAEAKAITARDARKVRLSR
jgi:NAD(P)-dependent dehydrogenase (short-subunit alcohol dehydrogenase family)